MSGIDDKLNEKLKLIKAKAMNKTTAEAPAPDIAPEQDADATAKLFEAINSDNCDDEDTSEVEAAIKAGADVDATDDRGRSPLHLAAKLGWNLCIELLLDAGADVDALGYNKESPLYVATEEYYPVTMKFLLDHGADPDGCSHFTPLHKASWGYDDGVKLLLEAGADANAIDKGGNTPLHYAAGGRGNSKCVRLLLEHDADCKIKNNDGETPLDWAEKMGRDGQADIIKEYQKSHDSTLSSDNNDLNDANADSDEDTDDSQDKRRAGTLEDAMARLEKQLEANQNRQQRGEGKEDNDLIKATRDGSIDDMKKALDSGINVSSVDRFEHETALHIACSDSDEMKVRLLLEAGADVSAPVDDGHTPLHSAAEAGSGACVQLLLDAGADINAKNSYEDTPLHIAAACGCLDCAKLLLDDGADITAENDIGETPLDECLSEDIKDELEAYANQKDNRPGLTQGENNTAEKKETNELILAAKSGDDAAVKDVLSSGCAIDSADEKGRTPLWYAAEADYLDCVKLLLEAGADYQHQDDDGATPYDAADDMAAAAVKVFDKKHGVKLGMEAETTRQEYQDKKMRAAMAGQLTATVDKGIVDDVRAAIEAGADVNTADENGRTPLHAAAETGSSEITALLLDAGGDYLAQDNDGYTPLDKALEKSNFQLLADIKKYDGENGCRITKDVEIRLFENRLRQLRGETDTESCRPESGYTAGTKADTPAGATLSEEELAKLNKELSEAVEQKDLAKAKELIGKGADINAADKEDGDDDNSTMLRVAAYNGDAEEVKFLLELGADVNVVSGWNEQIPLHAAMIFHNMDVVKMLLEAGSDLEAENSDGATPLHMAAASQDAEVVRCLLDAGANPDCSNNDGESPLDYCEEQGDRCNQEVVKLLQDAMAG